MVENPTILKQLPSGLSSQLRRRQLLQDDIDQVSDGVQLPLSQSPMKPRPWSSSGARPSLSPSPAFLETKSSKDDSHVEREPVTPKRPNIPRGLSLQTLQMPPRDISSSSTANLSTNLNNRVPLSPKLDSASHFASAASVLPRRSRGLDFARACTNLHHSTLAEQSSPDSSPVIGGRAVNIPRKAHVGGSGPESPMFPSATWSTMGTQERNVMSSSIGSVNMLESESSSDSSDDDMMRGGEDEDTIHMTPQAYRSGFGINPFNTSTAPSPGIMDLSNPFSPAAANLMSFKRRQRHGRSTRKSSSSTSIQSSMPSPGPASPPLHKTVEMGMGGNYFPKDKRGMESRRESLSLGTNDLHISDGTENEEPESRYGANDALGIPIPGSMDERRRVIGRAVTRRSNMLPKTKTFARIRAALQEESTPIDTECRREAEVIRQVMESDSPESNAPPSQPATTTTSPYLLPATAGPSDALEDLTEIMGGESSQERRRSTNFRGHTRKKSAGPDFWNSVDDRMRTPPPIFPRGGSSGISEDVIMDTPASSIVSVTPRYASARVNTSPSRCSTPQPMPTAGEVTRKALGKRRRDDDLDPYMFKRRAVSPGLSLQNSPVLPPSPAQRDGGWWQSKANRESTQGHTSGERTSSGGSGNGNGGISKRVGLQGMTDTNDGLMNMSIE